MNEMTHDKHQGGQISKHEKNEWHYSRVIKYEFKYPSGKLKHQ